MLLGTKSWRALNKTRAILKIILCSTGSQWRFKNKGVTCFMLPVRLGQITREKTPQNPKRVLKTCRIWGDIQTYQIPMLCLIIAVKKCIWTVTQQPWPPFDGTPTSTLICRTMKKKAFDPALSLTARSSLSVGCSKEISKMSSFISRKFTDSFS